MPDVRQKIYNVVYSALSRGQFDPARHDRDLAKEVRRKAIALTALFIQAFYPRLARPNEAELVRKSIQRSDRFSGKRTPRRLA